ncbi:phosphate transport system permease protein PstA [Iodidimonas gelatinilytica]|uniref:Phosphate transport system permease protein PstA n=1 Tax=Iodidimonas gelatinilytica TaxID=1236966 RepID=A0A5A7MKX8_9PROT|nr:phosphate ABC transporter permease PstA [Iodidimonas gelatinilytica]GEQ96590.1 phosphate transport system permease protein PstA [Iodidimonas gelatinilytica]
MKRSVSNRILATSFAGGAFLLAALFLWILGDILWRGLAGIDLAFLIQNPLNAGRSGGIRSVLVATLYIISLSIVIAAPLGLLAGMFLSELCHVYPRISRLIRQSLDTLAGVPSIIFGLFGNAVFAQYLGLRVSILTGALTLAVMILPFLIRSVEHSLRSLPAYYHRSAQALGLSRTTIMGHILLPAALPGLGTGLVLGIGRALAETAALVFTSGYVARMPGSVFDSGRALSVHIFDLAMNVPGGSTNAYKSAAVLVALLLIINLAIMALGHMRNRRRGEPNGC